MDELTKIRMDSWWWYQNTCYYMEYAWNYTWLLFKKTL